MATITASKSLRRALLAPTSLAVFASKSVTALTRSGTTATATCTSHGYSTNDWVLIAGATNPYYDGPFLITVVDANTFTFVIAADPGADAAGTITAQKGLAAAIWGDGTTGLAGCALPSADNAQLGIRVTNGATGPTVAATTAVYTSDTGAAGTWEALTQVAPAGTVALADNVSRVNVDNHRFILVFAYGNTGQAVLVKVWGSTEITFLSA